MIAISTGKTLKKSESTNLNFFHRNTLPHYGGDTIRKLIREHITPYQLPPDFKTKPAELSTFMRTWIEEAESMTEAEYIDKVRYLPSYKPELQKPMIEWEIYSKCEAFLAT